MSTIQDISYFIPQKYRRTIYAALAFVGLALACTTVGFLALALALPKWLVAAQAVFGVLSTATHYVAKTNTPPDAP